MHGLAVNYHWSEEQIFSLPLCRLLAYRNAISEENGETVPENEPESEELLALQQAMIEIMSRRHE